MKLIWLLVFLICSASIFAFEGQVLDKKTGEPLYGVSVAVEGSRIGAVTDADGRFKLSLQSPGIYKLSFSFVGYTRLNEHVELPVTDEKSIFYLEPAAYDLSEVVVSISPFGSGFRYQPTQQFSQEKVERMQDMSLGAMLDGQPGVASHSMGPAPTRPVLRGLDGDRVLVLENGERMGDLSSTAHDHVVSLEPLATREIEIVRGPAGLLFGSSAIGGVVNLITSDIPEGWKTGPGLDVRLTGSTVNEMFAGMAAYTHGWSNSALQGRLSYRFSDELKTPEGRLPGTEITNLEGAVGYGFKRGNTGGGASMQYVDMVYGIPEEIDDPDERVEIRMNKQSLQTKIFHEREGFFDKIEWRLNTARFFQQEIEMEFEPDGEIDEDIELEFEQYSLSTTLTAQHRPVGIFSRGAVGINIFARNLDVGGDEAFTPGYRTLNFAAFLFEEIPLHKKLNFQAGVRFDMSLNQTLQNDLFPDLDKQNQYFNYAASVGLNYKPFTFLETGFQFARAFRNPTLEELYAHGPHIGAGVFEIGNPDMKVEEALGADVFLVWKNPRFRLEQAFFVNRILNFIAFSTSGEIDNASGLPIFLYEQKEALLLGGEFNFSAQIYKGLSAAFIADYVFGQRTDNNDPLPFMPPFRTRLQLNYEHQNFHIGTDVRYTHRQDRVAPVEAETAEYWLLGFNAGCQFDFHGNHYFSLRVQNALNTVYRDHLSRVFERENPMPARNFMFSYRYRL